MKKNGQTSERDASQAAAMQKRAATLYQGLLQQVADFFANAAADAGEAMKCGQGCAGCCVGKLSVSAIEADAIRQRLQRAPVERNKTEDGMCIFLSEGSCGIYEERPLVCRTQGLMLRYQPEGKLPLLTTCNLNFTDKDAAPQHILNADTLNLKLAALNSAYCGEEASQERVSLVALAAEKW